MSNEKPPIDHEARIKAQELINLAEDCNNDKVYTQFPEGVSHPTEMYDPSPPLHKGK